MHKAHIDIAMTGAVAGVGAEDSIKLDGADIGRCITAIEIPLTKVGELNRVNLGLVVLDGYRYQGAAHVGVTDETAQLLVKLGWTPPGGNALINALAASFATHVREEHGVRFVYCQQQPCVVLPAQERAALCIDTRGHVISRHPVDPANLDLSTFSRRNDSAHESEGDNDQ